MRISTPVSPSPHPATPSGTPVAKTPETPSPATRFLSGLEKRPLAELLFKDVMAFNVPKISLTRTWAECADTATLELSNSAVTLFSSLGAPPLMRRPASWLSGIPLKELESTVSKHAATSVKLARLGAAFGFLFPFGAAFWAIPFVRNWLTLQRTQSANFESIIGFGDPNNKQPKRSFEEQKNYQRNMAGKIFLTGLSLGMGLLTAFSLAARSAAAAAREEVRVNGERFGARLSHMLENRFRKPWEKFFHDYDLKGPGANQVGSKAAQLIFWGAPAYLGWIHGARGDNERRERTLQAINGVFWFFFGSNVTGFLFDRAYSNLKEAAEPGFWKKEFLEKLVDTKLPAENWQAHFKKNEMFMKTLHDRLKGLTYADIQENVVDRASEAYQKLIRLKNWKFAISGLATPIVALAMVQGLNFYITARKIKAQAAQNPVKPPGVPAPSPALSREPPIPILTTPSAVSSPSSLLASPSSFGMPVDLTHLAPLPLSSFSRVPAFPSVFPAAMTAGYAPSLPESVASPFNAFILPHP
jgi:hypothetical protein